MQFHRTIALICLLFPAVPGCFVEAVAPTQLRSAGVLDMIEIGVSSGGVGESTDTGDDDSGADGGDSGSGDSGESGDYVDLWEPGETSGGDSEGSGDDGGERWTDGGSDSGSGEGGDTGNAPAKECADGEFTIHVFVKFKNGAEGSFSIATGTLTLVGEETEGTTVHKQYLACIPGDKIVGPKAPGVRLTAAVAGTNPADRVIGMRRGIDKNWISKCLGDPAKSCWIDAKFNAEGKNTLPIAVAVVYAELNRIETAPPPKEVIVK